MVVYASSMSHGEGDDVGYTRRLLHPSQDGFMCKVRTCDDMNAGLKTCLASDCGVYKAACSFLFLVLLY